jgi:hypothetical protein
MMTVVAVVVTWLLLSVPVSVLLGFILRDDDRLVRFERDDSRFRLQDRSTPVSS